MMTDKAFTIILDAKNSTVTESISNAIESVVRQSIGFQNNIQLIVIGIDPKTECAALCRKYQAEFPGNIVYADIEELRKPGARRAPMDLVAGRYVNFMRAEDAWAAGALAEVQKFLSGLPEPVGCVACRMLVQRHIRKSYLADRRFLNSQAADVLQGPFFPQMYLGSMLISADAIRRMGLGLLPCERNDLTYANRVILESGRYAVVKTAEITVFTLTSAIDALERTGEGYLAGVSADFLLSEFSALAALSEKRWGSAVPYLRHLILYCVREWLLERNLFKRTVPSHVALIRELLGLVGDTEVMGMALLPPEYRIHALSIKHGHDIRDDLRFAGGALRYDGIPVIPFESADNAVLYEIAIRDGVLRLDGEINLPIPLEGYALTARCDGEDFPLELYELDCSADRYSLGERIHRLAGFRVSLPLKGDRRVAELRIEGGAFSAVLGIGSGFVCKLNRSMRGAYYRSGGYLISYSGNRLVALKSSPLRHLAKECAYIADLALHDNPGSAEWRLLIRLAQFLHRLTRRQLWLFVDRFSSAGDNAECLFRYAVSLKDQRVRPVFVLEKGSADFRRMRGVGRVIPYGSRRYKIAYATAERVVSSQSFYSAWNTFNRRNVLLQDCFRCKFVYLQHGVIKDNHADSQGKHKKALDMFVVSAQKEYDSIVRGVGGNYGYDGSVVKLTGLARYDDISFIEPGKRNVILLAPTWRTDIGGQWVSQAQNYAYSPEFRSTEFFAFFNGMVTDPRILDCLKRYGYVMKIRLHPRVMAQQNDFTVSERVVVDHGRNTLRQEMEQTALLVTDYSSIAFDYAYAGIPAVYAQFDRERFYSNHSYTRGYFDYETDGFGPVCCDYESSVRAVISCMERGCVMEEEYEKRRREFFAYFDGRNRERIYREIIQLDDGGKP